MIYVIFPFPILMYSTGVSPRVTWPIRYDIVSLFSLKKILFLNSQRYGCVEIINYDLSTTLEKNELELESYQEAMDSREKEMVTSNARENEFSEEKWDLDYGETT